MFMNKESKKTPKFRDENQERDFWSKSDSTEHIDWDKGDFAVFPKLKPSTKMISLRLPESLLDDLRVLANKRDVPYQSLIKIILKDSIDKELRRS